jgi:hypothetical protein
VPFDVLLRNEVSVVVRRLHKDIRYWLKPFVMLAGPLAERGAGMPPRQRADDYQQNLLVRRDTGETRENNGNQEMVDGGHNSGKAVDSSEHDDSWLESLWEKLKKYNVENRFCDYSQQQFAWRLAEELLHPTSWKTWSDHRCAIDYLVPYLSVWRAELPSAVDLDLAVWQEGEGLREVAHSLPRYTLQILCGVIAHAIERGILVRNNPKFILTYRIG